MLSSKLDPLKCMFLLTKIERLRFPKTMGSIAHQFRVIHSCIKKKRCVRHTLSAGTVFRFTKVENLQRGILLHLICNKADINSPNQGAVLKKKKDKLEGVFGVPNKLNRNTGLFSKNNAYTQGL